jgi:hypothetical protein
LFPLQGGDPPGQWHTGTLAQYTAHPSSLPVLAGPLLVPDPNPPHPQARHRLVAQHSDAPLKHEAGALHLIPTHAPANQHKDGPNNAPAQRSQVHCTSSIRNAPAQRASGPALDRSIVSCYTGPTHTAQAVKGTSKRVRTYRESGRRGGSRIPETRRTSSQSRQPNVDRRSSPPAASRLGRNRPPLERAQVSSPGQGPQSPEAFLAIGLASRRTVPG